MAAVLTLGSTPPWEESFTFWGSVVGAETPPGEVDSVGLGGLDSIDIRE